MCDWLVLDCVMQCHPGTSVAAVHHEITNYLKMAPYRQGGAGKGASLAEDDVASPDEADNDNNNWLLTAILIAMLYLVFAHQANCGLLCKVEHKTLLCSVITFDEDQ